MAEARQRRAPGEGMDGIVSERLSKVAEVSNFFELRDAPLGARGLGIGTFGLVLELLDAFL